MGSAPQQSFSKPPDLSVCEREPIHIPASIEPNGVLLVLSEPELIIVQASANTEEFLGSPPEALIGTPLERVFKPASLGALRFRILPKNLEGKRRYVSGIRVRHSSTAFDGLIHRSLGILIIELEPSGSVRDERSQPDFYESLTDASADLNGQFGLAELSQRIVAYVRNLTRFDRVMLYRFLADDSGCVIAEDRREDLIPYLGLRYPASDIPPQARRLYLLNTLRLKVDVNARPVPLVPAVNPVTNQQLDMSHCVLRAMSPVHVEYLRNMGVSASMSISIIKGDRLWGLIACHHLEPKSVPHPIRICCDVLGRVFAAQLPAAVSQGNSDHVAALRQFREQLSQRLRAQSDVRNALIEEQDRLVSMLDATGAAVCFGGDITLLGATPPRDDVIRLVDWLTSTQSGYAMSTEQIAAQYPDAKSFSDGASGLLSARITLDSPNFVLWFRPAVARVVEWGGNPAKPVEETESGKRISPRLSFERWKEMVRDHSEPWQDYEQEFVLGLRQDIAEALVIQKIKEVNYLNLELARSNIELNAFAYAASHDLQEPVRTICAFAQLLGRRAGLKLDEQERQLLNLIEQAANRMSGLISALLAYAQVRKNQQCERNPICLENILCSVLANLDSLIDASKAVITFDQLPTVNANSDQVMQLMQNLIGNAIKYCKPEESPCIHISALLQSDAWHISVSDNGQGFSPDHAEWIFGAFKRLHGREIPGNGIGLALCRRIVENHGGTIWAESKGPGYGATFWFALPQS